MLAPIILGTAQFGMDYGLANQAGRLGLESAAATLRIARQGGVDLIDTAVAYGESESRLGSCDLAGFRTITKLPEVPVGCPDVSAWVQSQVAGSLERLRLQTLHGLLLHRPQQLLEPTGDELYRSLLELQEAGIVEKIGISIYEPSQLEPLLRHRHFDIVQAPLNVLDRRLADSGWLSRLTDSGCTVHARSIFLQGLLLMSAAERPDYFDRWTPLFVRWESWLVDAGCSPLEVCLRFARSIPEIAGVVLGVDGPGQLQQILGSDLRDVPSPPLDVSSTDPALLNPSLWNGP